MQIYVLAFCVTFQVESGEQIELCVKRNEYDTMTIGGSGVLTYQGIRYKDFAC